MKNVIIIRRIVRDIWLILFKNLINSFYNFLEFISIQWVVRIIELILFYEFNIF